MTQTCRSAALAVLCLMSTAVLAAEFKVEPVKDAPKGLSPEIAKLINPAGYRVSGDNGIVCEVWMVADVPLKPKFKPTDVVKYPFLAGELVGAIRFPDEAEAHDFRGQMVPPGTYTLRYGQQPLDGNHLGTSDVRDFLLICPPMADATPKRIEKTADLFKLSAKSVNTTHPAVFQLHPPPEKAWDAAGAEFEAEKMKLTVHLNADATADGKKVKVPLNLVAIGKSEG